MFDLLWWADDDAGRALLDVKFVELLWLFCFELDNCPLKFEWYFNPYTFFLLYNSYIYGDVIL
jgi:hypothetical protein